MAKNGHSKHQKQFDDLRGRIKDAKSLRQMATEQQNGNQSVTISGWTAALSSGNVLNALAAATPDAGSTVVGGIIALLSADENQILAIGGGLTAPPAGTPFIFYGGTGLADVSAGDQLPAVVIGLVEAGGNVVAFGGTSTVTVTATNS